MAGVFCFRINENWNFSIKKNRLFAMKDKIRLRIIKALFFREIRLVISLFKYLNLFLSNDIKFCFLSSECMDSLTHYNDMTHDINISKITELKKKWLKESMLFSLVLYQNAFWIENMKSYLSIQWRREVDGYQTWSCPFKLRHWKILKTHYFKKKLKTIF